MGFLGFMLMMAGIFCIIPSAIWMLIEVIKTGLIWTLVYLFVPFGGIIWLVKHWEQGAPPFALGVLGAVLFVPGSLMTGGMDSGDSLSDSEYVEQQDSDDEEEEFVTAEPGSASAEEEDASDEEEPAVAAGAGNSATQAAPAGAPVETLWPQYFAAVSKIEAGDPAGVREFESLLYSDDLNWFRQNASALAAMTAPGAAQGSPEQTKLAVLKALLRNMPTRPPAEPPTVTVRDKLAVARLVTQGPAGLQTYTTVLQQENGRWVFVQPFFARTFIWLPQLTAYKRAHNVPLSSDEQMYAGAGTAPFQQQVQAIYTAVGYQAR